METKTGRPGQRGKSIDQKIAYALGSRVRIEVLRLLNEGVLTADGLADLIGESRQNIHHHLKELLGGGMIEIAKIEKKRNTDLFYYRALGRGSLDRQTLEALTSEKRQEIAGLIVQHSSVEVMAALAAGKLSNDPRVCLMWNWLRLDDQGREELFEEQERFWERIEEIEADSVNRSADSGEPTPSYIVAQWAFERAAIAPVPSADADKQAKSF